MIKFVETVDSYIERGNFVHLDDLEGVGSLLYHLLAFNPYRSALDVKPNPNTIAIVQIGAQNNKRSSWLTSGRIAITSLRSIDEVRSALLESDSKPANTS